MKWISLPALAASSLLLGAFAASAGGAQGRSVIVNREQVLPAMLPMLDTLAGTRVPDGRYWYDPYSGLVGLEGGPAMGILPSGLHSLGRLHADASRGGTGIFINGRELHPVEAMRLAQILGRPVAQGRYWLDARGNAGYEGGPPLVNLYQAAGAAGNGGSFNHSSEIGSDRYHLAGDGQGGFIFSGSDGTSWYSGQ